ncbi:hypothetical protein DPMN_052831 [Dreissena polymorpha]|uniref:Uncharacterized protein n=1 Tax=Dreissena polymorpha TaxID=45954 RepID=A0A9D4CL13_DREPO|nr:hypothetical protein DPMN_052778 [Dreissena polymorpha]KAH3726951.1 hypothetical protein DPMN_052831 [Dreissena polymorpha]
MTDYYPCSTIHSPVWCPRGHKGLRIESDHRTNNKESPPPCVLPLSERMIRNQRCRNLKIPQGILFVIEAE